MAVPPHTTSSGIASSKRNQVRYQEPAPNAPHPIPSLTQPQLAVIEEQEPPPVPPLPPKPAAASEPAPEPRRANRLPVPDLPGDSPLKGLPASPSRKAKPLPQPSISDSKTMFVVSDIVDAMRAQAGYAPLPDDPAKTPRSRAIRFFRSLGAWLGLRGRGDQKPARSAKKRTQR